MTADPFPSMATGPVHRPTIDDLGSDAKRTVRNQRLLRLAIHPATRRPIIEGTESTCGDCLNCWRKTVPSGDSFFKCRLAGGQGHDGPDIRIKWPACTAFVTGDLTTTRNPQ